MKKFFLLLISISILLLVIGSKSSVFAQTNTSSLHVTTSPIVLSLTTKPGTTVNTEIKIHNDGTHNETLTLSLMKFKSSGDTGLPKLIDRESGDDYFDWVTFSPKQFTLIPNEWKVITVTINVPASAALGYYYAATFSRTNPTQTNTPNQTTLAGAVATLILLNVDVPNAKREVSLATFSVDQSIYEFLPVQFNVKVKNSGNIFVAPRGNIFINQEKNKDLAVLEVNPGKGNLLPNSNRIFTTSWTDGFPVNQPKVENGKFVQDTNGKVKEDLVWDFKNLNKIRFGKYTAHLLLIYDNGKQDIPIEGDVSFTVIPWRIMGVGLLITIILLFGLFAILKTMFRAVKRK